MGGSGAVLRGWREGGVNDGPRTSLLRPGPGEPVRNIFDMQRVTGRPVVRAILVTAGKYIDVCGLIVFAAGVIAAVQAGTVFLFRAVFIQHLIDGFLSVMRHWRYLHISVKSRIKWNKYCI